MSVRTKLLSKQVYRKGGLTTKKRTSLILFSLLVVSFFQGPASFAEEYHSHGVTSFYGIYEKPEQPGGSQYPSGSVSSQAQENLKNGRSTKAATPNYSASGQAIIPKTGDQNFVVMQVSGAVLLLTVISYVLIKKKGENHQ